MRDPDHAIWDGVLAHLRNQHPSLCRAWFARLEPLGMADGTLMVRATSKLHRDYLERECLNAFNDSLQAVSGRLIGMRFLGPHESENDRPGARAVGRAHPVSNQPYADGLVVNPDYGFENFVIGPGNRLAHAAALAVAANVGHSYNPLFIHGGVGLGKTHLIQAIGNEIVNRFPEKRVIYLSTDIFTVEFVESIQANKVNEFSSFYRSMDVLIIDDIQFLIGKEKTQDLFFHIFNMLHQ